VSTATLTRPVTEGDGRTALVERFLERMVLGLPDQCWTWERPRTSHGYGLVIVVRQNVKLVVQTHLLSYELFVGSVPAKHEIDHTCHNGSGCSDGRKCVHRACYNPAHLEAVSHRENVLRGDGIAARRARQTECIHGHPLAGANLRLTKNGHRQCRECARRSCLEWYYRNKAGVR